MKQAEDFQYWKRAIYRPGPVLDPVSRISEVIFGLIMVLTFTGSISVATAGREEIRVILWAALGCNVAWGIVDAFMYLMSLMLERGDAAAALRKVQHAENTGEAANVMKDYLPPVLIEVMQPAQYESLRMELRALPPAPTRIPLFWPDVKAAIYIFFLVALSTLPCSLPFIFITDIGVAMRVSNWIALALLFATGYMLGRHTGYNSLLLGVVVAALGALLVLMTIALGG